MIAVAAMRTRYRRIAGCLDERGRRLFAATEAMAVGLGGVTAVSAATGIARSTINRGIAELKAGRHEIGRGSGAPVGDGSERLNDNRGFWRRSKR